MSKPNVHGLPQYLRKDGKGYFLDYFIQEGGLRKRKRVRLGQIPVAQAKKILAQHMQEMVERKVPGRGKAGSHLSRKRRIPSWPIPRQEGKATRTTSRWLRGSKAYFGNRPLEA